MDAEQIKILKKLGINTNNTTIEIFEDVINIANHLYDLLEQSEEDKFREELKRLKLPTN